MLIKQFGGLHQRGGRQDPNGDGALVCLNVRTDDPARRQNRGGYTVFNSNAWAGTGNGLGHFNDASQFVAVDSAGRLRYYDDSTGTHGDLTGGGVYTGAMVEFFGQLWLANTTVGDGLTQWNGTSASHASKPLCKFVTAWAAQERLVTANSDLPPATVVNPDRVNFSAAGSDGFGADDFVDLSTADGEAITGMAAWRNLLFVFKPSRFFVFHNVATDSTGGAIFNYDTIDGGIGCTLEHGVGAGRDGVYFYGRDGIYRTTGSTPTLISGDLQGAFDGDVGDYAISPAITDAQRFAVSTDRVYVVTSAGAYTFDLRTAQWAQHDFAHQPAVLLPYGDPREFYFLSGGKLYHSTDAATDDAGTAIDAEYRAGFSDLGAEGQKSVRMVELAGEGTIAFGWNAQGLRSADVVPSSASVTMPVDGVGYYTKSAMGRLLSYGFTTTGAWVLDRVRLDVGSDE